MPPATPSDVPFLDLANQSFSVRSQAVREAREKSWYARTPYGLAILRYAEVGSLLRDARLRQGSYKWPAHNHASGLFADWWLRMLLNRVGDVTHAVKKPIRNRLRSPRANSCAGQMWDRLSGTIIINIIPRVRK